MSSSFLLDAHTFKLLWVVIFFAILLFNYTFLRGKDSQIGLKSAFLKYRPVFLLLAVAHVLISVLLVVAVVLFKRPDAAI